MKSFKYERVKDYQEAVEKMQNASECVSVISGGTDFLNNWKDQILTEYPETILQLDQINGAAGITRAKVPALVSQCGFPSLEKNITRQDQADVSGEKGDFSDSGVLEEGVTEGWRIGAETRLSDLASQKEIPILAEAAGSIANEQIRNQATIAGDLFQDVRCKYYHFTDFMGGCVTCNRKGGEFCCAMHGESPRHSVFGGMYTQDSPCRQECPLGTNIPGYIEEIRKGNIQKAAQILLDDNPFPMLLSRVCPHPCEGKCNQAKFGDSVSIHNLERFVGDYILEHLDEFYKAPEQKTGKKIAVVGGGPGGLSAAFYLRRAGHEVLVIERNHLAGGVMRYGIPHYRLPKQYLDRVIEGLENMGISFRMDTEVGVDVSVEELLANHDYVYLGTGAWKQPVLGIAHEEVAEFGLNFLTGVASFLKKHLDGEVLVCGGGNVAMDAALTASRLGAKKVTVICLEQEYEMPASPEEIARCKADGVEFHCGWGLGEVKVDEDGKPVGMLSMKCLSVYDENHRFSPKYSETERVLYPADTIILATGQRVDISYLGDDLLSKLKSPRGLIGTDLATGKTDDPRIFAGGDAASGPNIASRAVAGGKKAAASICASLKNTIHPEEKNGTAEGKLSADDGRSEVFKTIDPAGIGLREACKELMKPVAERTLFDEDAATLEFDEIQREAGRCMNCSCFAVNSSELAPVLYLLEAEFVTTKRMLRAKELLASKKSAKEVLDPDEILTDILIPKSQFGQLFFERTQAVPGSDFSHVNLAAGISMKDGIVEEARFVFGGVAGVPYEAKAAAEYLRGRKLGFDTIENAASRTVVGACAFPEEQEQLWEMKRLIRKVLQKAANSQ